MWCHNCNRHKWQTESVLNSSQFTKLNLNCSTPGQTWWWSMLISLEWGLQSICIYYNMNHWTHLINVDDRCRWLGSLGLYFTLSFIWQFPYSYAIVTLIAGVIYPIKQHIKANFLQEETKSTSKCLWEPSENVIETDESEGTLLWCDRWIQRSICKM